MKRKARSIINYYGKGVTPKYVSDSSIIVLNQKCIRNNQIDYSFARFIDDTRTYNTEKFVREGDILINSTGQGTAGRVAIVKHIPQDKKVITDSHILTIRTNDYYESVCLNYSLFSIEKVLQTFLDGSTGQGEFDKQRLFNVIVNYPKENYLQEGIANFLTAVDTKIELNHKINDNLERMAKSIYDYWFVQFDFPDANGKPYKSSGGKMVWSEVLKNDIPKGWNVTKLEEWIELNKSGDWGKENSEGNYTTKVTCIRGADINGMNGIEQCSPPERFIIEKNAFKILENGDIIVEISGGSPTQSTGRLTYITEATLQRFNNPLICSNFCKPVSLKNKKLLYNFVYFWNNLYSNKIFFGFEGKTSGIKNLLFDAFVRSYSIATPSKEVVDQFYRVIDSIQSKKQMVLKENQQLASLRDWLLPMLMNGQVKVK